MTTDTDLIRPGAAIELLGSGATWSEGPLWIPDERVVRWSDIPGNRILRWHASTGSVEVHRDEVEFTNGRALDRDGMLERAVDDDGHARYRLTPLGRTLHEPLQALRIWAESHVDEVLDAQDRYDDEADRRLLGGSDGAGVSAAVRPTDASPRGDILQG